MTDTKKKLLEQSQIRDNESPCYFDVDETLVFKSPFSDVEHYIQLDYYGIIKYAKPVTQHIEFLKACKARGAEVTVWSANGYRWAQEVVNALGLAEYVDYVATKPRFYVDDKKADDWMNQVYITESK